MIHPTAIIHPDAKLGKNITVGPYARIEGNSTIGDDTVIDAHAMIGPYTEVGPNCHIYSYAAVGGDPQSLKYRGEITYAKIGANTIIREFATINRGTEEAGGITEVGDKNLIMTCAHVAHDCKTGTGVIMANVATLAGHIEVGNYVTIGGLTAVHQFVKIGDYAFLGGTSSVVQDVPPYVIASGNRAELHGLNKVGLGRHGFTDETMAVLKKLYRIFFRSGLKMAEAMEKARTELPQMPEVKTFLAFLETSERGLSR